MAKWQQVELDMVNILADCFDMGGKVATELELQYADIDVVASRGYTISVKEQTNSSLKSGNFAFETLLEDSSTGHSIDGSFTKCQADYYAIFREFKGSKWCFFAPTTELKEFVNSGDFRKVTTTNKTMESSNQGRKYNRGHVTLVPIKDLYYQPYIYIFIQNKNGVWKSHMKQKG